MDKTGIISQFRNRNLKATKIRMDLMSILSSSQNAVPHSMIQKELKDFDRVTLYRTLNALIDHGLVHKALTEGNETYYALCNTGCDEKGHVHTHVHFHCTNCDEVYCLPMSESFSLKIPDYQINNLKIEATGRCKECLGASKQ